MSMIIDRIGRYVLVGSAALAAWMLVLVVGTLVVNPARALVVAPRGVALSSAMRADALLVDVHAGSAVVAATRRAGFVRRLYAGGAWLVLPVLDGGCVSSTRSKQGVLF